MNATSSWCVYTVSGSKYSETASNHCKSHSPFDYETNRLKTVYWSGSLCYHNFGDQKSTAYISAKKQIAVRIRMSLRKARSFYINVKFSKRSCKPFVYIVQKSGRTFNRILQNSEPYKFHSITFFFASQAVWWSATRYRIIFCSLTIQTLFSRERSLPDKYRWAVILNAWFYACFFSRPMV